MSTLSKPGRKCKKSRSNETARIFVSKNVQYLFLLHDADVIRKLSLLSTTSTMKEFTTLPKAQTEDNNNNLMAFTERWLIKTTFNEMASVPFTKDMIEKTIAQLDAQNQLSIDLTFSFAVDKLSADLKLDGKTPTVCIIDSPECMNTYFDNKRYTIYKIFESGNRYMLKGYLKIGIDSLRDLLLTPETLKLFQNKKIKAYFNEGAELMPLAQISRFKCYSNQPPEDFLPPVS